MGAYLSQPQVDKTSEDEANAKYAFGASSMQGWRVSQEVRTKSFENVGGFNFPVLGHV